MTPHFCTGKHPVYLPPVAEIACFSSKDVLTVSQPDDTGDDMHWD